MEGGTLYTGTELLASHHWELTVDTVVFLAPLRQLPVPLVPPFLQQCYNEAYISKLHCHFFDLYSKKIIKFIIYTKTERYEVQHLPRRTLWHAGQAQPTARFSMGK